MARKTYLQIVNQVLRKLRRDEVSEVLTTAYSRLIGELVNQAKREVEDAWNWSETRTRTTISTVASDPLYSLTGFGDRYKIQLVFNNTNNSELKAETRDYFDHIEFGTNADDGTPQYYRVFGFDSSGDPQVELSPTPDGVFDIRIIAYSQQADLASDETELKVPSWPVILGAYSLAISERGEDGGMLSDESKEHYLSALNDAIAQDNINNARGTTSDWVVQ